jgi:folate-binding protein YgfZ
MKTDQAYNLPAFLSSLGIVVDQQQHTVVTNNADNSDNIIMPLSYYGFLAINGEEAAKFLQGQITCDVNTVTHEHSTNGAYCSPKGRMVSSFRLASVDPEKYLLRMRNNIVANTQSVFAKYIVFSKAEQFDTSSEYQAIGLFGSRARAAINAAFGSSPEQANGCVNHKGQLAIQLDDDGLMYECWVNTSDIKALWPKLSQGLNLEGSRRWEQLTIAHGNGEITAETIDMFIPQMLNYQVTGGISFTKGCYTGQEVVARMQYKGKLKRPMYRVKFKGQPLIPGTNLYSPQSEQSIGNIVNSVCINDDKHESLAVITSKAVEQGPVLAGADRVTLEHLPLPYAISNDA